MGVIFRRIGGRIVPIASRKVNNFPKAFVDSVTAHYRTKPCNGCTGKNDPFMVVDKIWKKVAKPNDQFLCLKCVEKRIGRKLEKKDFTTVPLNQWLFASKRIKR